ncbi:B9 domain-containing protein 1 [Tetrabaena socialis]|uniref:B9 domain-containing protein 1 n=1 Tax=Tetrabaena socialis TaxID=47790 RepID=A0A2J8AK17_9CHLO|nr:B9 domain-containing protein 1 [Tetrabaena socialis]|eukprot:PNH12840.1 B9 domain-containing protein 1 [Tetrabaena socialis]
MGDSSAPTSFTILVTGQIECAEIPNCTNAYLKFQFVAGEDWQLLDGLEEGITQAARVAEGRDGVLVWNFPIDITYKTTNAFGWPQLVVAVYGLDMFGRDVIKGYACMHLPTCAGRYNLTMRLFRPRSASLLQSLTSFMSGMPAEFSDPKFPSYGEGREVTRVQSGGHVKVQLNLLTKDMDMFGYVDGSGRDPSLQAVTQM